MTEKSNPILYQLDGAIARVTLNRPEKRNALNDALIAGLKNALKQANGDEAVRVVVISGAGQDFCSGADLAALQKISEASVAENVADARSLMEVFLLMRQVGVPVVAAVRNDRTWVSGRTINSFLASSPFESENAVRAAFINSGTVLNLFSGKNPA